MRQLHPSHFAFMRALVQGVALRDAWSRYLHPQADVFADVAAMRETVQWIRDAFATAARRERRHGVARLVLVDLSNVQDTPARPSLQAFAVERGLEDFSEAEQLEAYESAYGRATPRHGRRARLVARQLEALRWLESLSSRPPRLADAVDAWLPPSLAERLAAAGVTTLQQLVDHVNGAPGRWWSAFRAIGPAKARRIETWLREHRQGLGVSIRPRFAAVGPELVVGATRTGADGTTARVEPAAAGPAPARTAIVPLEHFAVPAELDGRQGRYRRPAGESRLGVASDREALDAWLSSKPHASVHTRRAYRREAERFLLWAVLVRRVALSSVGAADAAAYLGFVAEPRPRADWCGPRHHPRWSPLWRPFEGRLSPAARRQTVAILRNLYAFLDAQGHVRGNPWDGAAAGLARRPAIDTTRRLTAVQRDEVEARLHLLPDTAAAQRLRLAWHLLQATGLRLSEAVAARLGDLHADATPAAGLWLRVPGPGQRARDLPLPAAVVDALPAYLAGRGLHPEPLHPGNADAYLLGHATDLLLRAPGLAAGRVVDPRQGISPSTLYEQFKSLFARCARVCRARGEAADAESLRRASTHWLRHMHGVQSMARGVPVESAQQRLGHASPSTTALYAAAARRDAAARLTA